MKTVTACALAALSAISLPAHAQAPDDEAADAGASIIVTASRSGEGVPASTLPASITLLDSEALDTRQTRIVSDILRDVPGVAVNRAGGVGGFTQLRLRGTEANHVLVLIDGIEAADPYYGEYDFATLIADPEARVEVLRGQQSSLYGSDAIGGVIQYLTLTGAEAPGISLRAEGGSFGTFGGAARIAGVKGDLDYALSSAYYHTDGYATARGGSRDIGSDNVGASAKLLWTPAANVRLTAVGRYSHTDADSNNIDNDPASPTFGTLIDSPGTYFHNRAFYGLLSAEVTGLDGRWVSTLSGQIADTKRTGYSPFGIDYGDKGQRLKGSFASSLRLGTDAVQHKITAAVDVEREQFRNIQPADFVFQGKRHTDNVGLVGQYELTAGALSLGGSVRHDFNNRFADATTWRVQGGYRLPTGTRIRAAYGTGVKNPGYYDLYGFSDGRYIGNPALRPEKSEGWEAGIDQEIAGGKASIGATWFDNRLKDEIFVTYPAPDFVATPANRGTRSQQQGLEVFASARPIPQLRLDAAYTYAAARENGVREIRRPRHIGSVNATVLSADQRFSGTLTLRYNGRQYDDAYIDPSYVPVRLMLKDYVLVNLGAQYQLRPGVAVFGRIENLTDERYEEAFSYVGGGRSATGGVKLGF
jgi:vitamin B12 transporter